MVITYQYMSRKKVYIGLQKTVKRFRVKCEARKTVGIYLLMQWKQYCKPKSLDNLLVVCQRIHLCEADCTSRGHLENNLYALKCLLQRDKTVTFIFLCKF